jgi:hypothetical protein
MFRQNIFYCLLGLLLFTLAGCATVGNFAAAPTTFNQTMAQDAVQQLSVTYPAAYTRFVIQQNAHDGFGIALLQNLRLKGYAIQQSNSTVQGITRLNYVVDTIRELENTSFYRVTLTLNQTQSLSQIYQRQPDGSLSAAGAWVHKE